MFAQDNVRFGRRARRRIARACTRCHGADDTPGSLPNLFRLTAEQHKIFNEIARRGAFASRGMTSFADVPSEQGARAIHASLIDEAHRLH